MVRLTDFKVALRSLPLTVACYCVFLQQKNGAKPNFATDFKNEIKYMLT
jgi:hypothetical protein